MRARSSVHNDSQTVAEIKRKNLELINRLVKVKPVVRASDQPRQYAIIKANQKRKAQQSLLSLKQQPYSTRESLERAEATKKSSNQESKNRIQVVQINPQRQQSQQQLVDHHVNKPPLCVVVEDLNSGSRLVSSQVSPVNHKEDESRAIVITHSCTHEKEVKRNLAHSQSSQSYGMTISQMRQSQQQSRFLPKVKDYHPRSNRQIAREYEQKQIHMDNQRMMSRLLSQKCLLSPVEKQLQEDYKRQKLLQMRSQLKGQTPRQAVAFTHKRQHSNAPTLIYQTSSRKLKANKKQKGLFPDETPNSRRSMIMTSNKTDKQFKKQMSARGSIYTSRSLLDLHKHSGNSRESLSRADSQTNIATDPYQVQKSFLVPGKSLLEHSEKMLTTNLSSQSSSPSPAWHAVSTLSRGRATSSTTDDEKGRTVFYSQLIENTKSGVQSLYQFSYDESAYYFKWRRGSGPQQTLILPVCRDTLGLLEEHSCDLDGLAKRLKVDRKTGKLFIKDFKPPVIDLDENKELILPMVSKLMKQSSEAKRNSSTALSLRILQSWENQGIHPSKDKLRIGSVQGLQQQQQRQALTMRNNSPDTFPSVFKSLANLKRSESVTETDKQEDGGLKTEVKDAYFKSKKMRGPPSISPLTQKKKITGKNLNLDLKLQRTPDQKLSEVLDAVTKSQTTKQEQEMKVDEQLLPAMTDSIVQQD